MLGLKHLHDRKRGLAQEPRTLRTVFRGAGIDLLIYLAAIVGPLALLPQVLQLYATRDASSLALSTWVMFGLMNVVWISYGLKHKERPIVLTNSALVILNSLVALGILLYA